MARQAGTYQEWDRSEWASIAIADRPESGAEGGRWNKFEWVGDRGRQSEGGRCRARDMAEGESSLSGFRHNPGTQHWSERATS